MDTSVEKAFIEAYDAHADAVFRHCYYRVSDRERALDLSREAFARTWEYLAKGNRIENLKAFIFRTANNLIIDHYRRKKESSLDALSEGGFDPSGDDHEHIEDAARGREALAAIATLGEEYRHVVVLRYVNDLSIGEIAVIRGESENAVSVRLHRALKKLKEFLEHGTT